MIEQLIQQIATLLRQGFAGIIPSPEGRIVAKELTELTEPLPVIAVYPGKLIWSQSLIETSTSRPRPEEFRQEIAVEAANPQGPYPLVKTPLRGSARGQILFDPGAVTERRMTAIENKEFTIDYQNPAITFNVDLTEASKVRLIYSFVGVFTIKEFEQNFLIDIYEADPKLLEQWTSLVTGMILTSHDDLIEQYNLSAKTEYVANQFITRHTLGRIHVLEGIPGRQESALKMQLISNAIGQVTVIKEIVDGFGLIEKIHSPGRVSEAPVDVEIGVE
jgi:hypothetical protein